MKKNNQVFDKIVLLEPSSRLKEAVFERISKEGRRIHLRNLFMFMSGLSFLISIFVMSGIFFGQKIITSDFWGIAYLGFTDLHLVVRYWQVFIWSLVENVPSVEIVAILLPFLGILFLFKQYGRQEQFLKFNYK
ncbi:MAG: hypothetical protein HGA61_01430 [Candidatus Moranbacteria bacterium]|nr:hypothetical protein [Candidatus Moranbacteria bacterium]